MKLTLKALTLIFATTLFSNFAFAEQFSYKCSAPESSPTLNAGVDGKIVKIKSLEVTAPSNSADFSIKMGIDGVASIDASNGDKKPKESILSYGVKEEKNGTLFELLEDKNNIFRFDGVYLEFGTIDAVTAGPILPGIYNSKISMGFIDSNVYYKNPSPMTVKKIVFPCKVTVSL